MGRDFCYFDRKICKKSRSFFYQFGKKVEKKFESKFVFIFFRQNFIFFLFFLHYNIKIIDFCFPKGQNHQKIYEFTQIGMFLKKSLGPWDLGPWVSVNPKSRVVMWPRPPIPGVDAWLTSVMEFFHGGGGGVFFRKKIGLVRFQNLGQNSKPDQNSNPLILCGRYWYCAYGSIINAKRSLHSLGMNQWRMQKIFRGRRVTQKNEFFVCTCFLGWVGAHPAPWIRLSRVIFIIFRGHLLFRPFYMIFGIPRAGWPLPKKLPESPRIGKLPESPRIWA